MLENRKDVRIEVKARNNLLLKKMEERGIYSVAELQRKINVFSQYALGRIINMKERARNEDGSWTKIAQVLSDFFQCMPEDLFSDNQQWEQLERNRSYAEITFAEAQQIAARTEVVSIEDRLQAQDLKKTLTKLLSDLAPREERVLRMRFGLGSCEEMTAKEIAGELGVSISRVNQIEARALQKLQHPAVARTLFNLVATRRLENYFRFYQRREGVNFDQKILDALE